MPHPKALPAADRLTDIVCAAAGLNPDGRARTMIESKKRAFGIVLDAERASARKPGLLATLQRAVTKLGSGRTRRSSAYD